MEDTWLLIAFIMFGLHELYLDELPAHLANLLEFDFDQGDLERSEAYGRALRMSESFGSVVSEWPGSRKLSNKSEDPLEYAMECVEFFVWAFHECDPAQRLSYVADVSRAEEDELKRDEAHSWVVNCWGRSESVVSEWSWPSEE